MQAPRHILQITDMYLRSAKVCQQFICFLLQGCFFLYMHSIVRGNTSHLLQQERERDGEKEGQIEELLKENCGLYFIPAYTILSHGLERARAEKGAHIA